MQRTLFSLILLVFLSLPGQTQDCDCYSNLEWVRTTFEENDAGFKFALSQKGEAAYAQHNAVFAEKVKTVIDNSDCYSLLYEWLTFFRSGHIAISATNQGRASTTSTEEPTAEEIRMRYQDWERMEVDLATFKEYLSTKETVDYEGIWISPPYTIGIKREDDAYRGFIIEADGAYWVPEQVKLKINADNSATFYMRDHSEEQFERAKLLGNNVLQMGFVTLQRTFPELVEDPEVARYFAAMEARKPFFKQLNETTTYVRIPSFSGSERGVIDSVVQAHWDQLTSTENLIIDLRNNGGGSDASFQPFVPLLYTNPIRTVGVDFYSTPLNNQRMLDFVQDPEYGFSEEEKEWAQKAYDKLAAQEGAFVNLNEVPISVSTYDTIYPYPRQIGIIIHEGNASTTEQFLLLAKQSKKAKLFGTSTAGILDISNMYFIPSPCNDFELGYSLSKSRRIPGMAIDDIGIQPDFYIDEGIPVYGWIGFVMGALSNSEAQASGN